MAEPLATPEDMEQRSLGNITTASHPFLSRELDAASRAIREACGWHVAPVDEVEYRRVTPWSEDIWLPAMEITGIVSAEIDGTAVNIADVRFDPGTGWTNLRGSDVRITFTAGFHPVPEDLVVLTLELASGGLGSPLGITREQAGGVSVTLDRASSKLTSADEPRLAPYKLGRIA